MDELIPLSVLELDLSVRSTGWAAGLAELGIPVQLDDVGRLAIARGDARRLFAERAEAEERAREVTARNDEQLERQRLASLPRGIPASESPDGVDPAV